MPSAQCLANIASEQPPYNIPCTEPFCVKTRYARNLHCSTRGLPMDTPVLSWDPDLPPPADGSCYCCCSCFALDTPIETGGGQYALIQNINGGDHITACDVDLNWKPTLVHF